MIKTTCLINNFNYGNFIIEAVESVLQQTVQFDEVIIVDDGSTDNSVQNIQEKYADNSQVKLIIKDKNEGQLSSFNLGYLASSGELICFLDSDDKYQPNYLESIIKVYNLYPECDFLYCEYEKFKDLVPSPSDKIPPSQKSQIDVLKYVRNLGCSAILTLHTKRYLGSATSTLSMRRKTAEKILPFPYLDDWKIRADDCLVYGASLVEAVKFRLSLKLVKYRIHTRNNFANKTKQDAKERKEILVQYRRTLALNRLFNFFSQQMNYHNKSELISLIPFEFKTIPQPDSKDFQKYFHLLWNSNLKISVKINISSILIKYMFLTRK
ncbi:MAG: glycosyltransferase family 2 protein [Richelia sp. SM2_1_7]|nr:glycosyltransferase family 2 protein [Richelia sp. SM2_1_7]